MTASPRTLTLVPATLDMYDAELVGDLHRLAQLLGTRAIQEWPPIDGEHDAEAVAFFRRTQTSGPETEGWLAHYACSGAELVGSAGFFGPPVAGTTEIGYSICARSRGRGFASAAVALLIELARTRGGRVLLAHVSSASPFAAGSIGALTHNGFTESTSERVDYRGFSLTL